jgi:hypothetical protein
MRLIDADIFGFYPRSTPMKMGRKSSIFSAGGVACFMKALSILTLKSNRQIELCFQRLGNM